MNVLVDTSVLVNALRDREGGAQALRRMILEGHTLAISAMTVGEVYAGVRVGEERKVEALLSTFECYEITAGLARRAGELRSSWRGRGRTLELADMIIAATALEYELALMTENRKDFPMEGLVLYP